MKLNTQDILLSSFSLPDFPQEKKMRGYQFYYDLFSDLSGGGVRSLIYQMVQKRLLQRISLNGQSFFQITNVGISKLTLLHPGLSRNSRKKGDTRGHVLVLLQYPDYDPHFFKLRKKLKQFSFVQMTRGVYYYSFATLPHDFFESLLENYPSSVCLIEAKSFSLASPEEDHSRFLQKKNFKINASGIISKLSKVIKNRDDKKSSSYEQKLIISTVFQELKSIVTDSDNLILEEKELQELFFQIIDLWSELVKNVYFSQK